MAIKNAALSEMKYDNSLPRFEGRAINSGAKNDIEWAMAMRKDNAQEACE